MTQRSYLWTTGATGDGAALVQDVVNRIFKTLLGDGVARGYLNELEVTVTGAATVSVNTGAAWVDGHPYDSDAAVTINLSTPAGGTGTTGGYIVLIRDYDARTIRLGKVQSADGILDLPTLTLGSGAASLYHFPLASYTIGTDSTVTLAHEDDEEPLEYLHPAFLIITAMIAAAAVTKAKLNSDVADGSTLELDAGVGLRIKDSGVTTAKIANSNVTTAKIADSNVTTAKIADANVTNAKLADASVTTNKIASGQINDVHIGFRVATMQTRAGHGNGSSDWDNVVAVRDDAITILAVDDLPGVWKVTFAAASTSFSVAYGATFTRNPIPIVSVMSYTCARGVVASMKNDPSNPKTHGLITIERLDNGDTSSADVIVAWRVVGED